MNTGNTPIKIGINARLFPSNWRPARDEIAFAHESGFDCIQFPGQEHGLDAERLGDTLPHIGQLLRNTSLTAVMEIVVRVDLSGHTRAGLTPVEVLQANLPAITSLDCNYVHWHLVSAERIDDTTALMLETNLVDQCATGVLIAEKHGFRFGFEHNEPLLRPFATPESCATLLAAVPNLGFVWDLNHTTSDLVAAYLDLTPRMTMLHVADTPLPDVNYHLPLGLGSIDFAAYFRGLLERGFRGPAILEIGGLPKSGGFGRDTDQALIDSRARLLSAITAASQT